ncbi:MAG TPA: hypothetical protein VD902_18370, partial [Symbiobacteriaceae bacterium]|nr:hypothetical protein [Symbiobacteriaceae bacterium]
MLLKAVLEGTQGVQRVDAGDVFLDQGTGEPVDDVPWSELCGFTPPFVALNTYTSDEVMFSEQGLRSCCRAQGGSDLHPV